jgi:integrase
MVLLDFGSGLRRGELIGLKWSDIDFAKKQTDVVRSALYRSCTARVKP